MIASKLALVVYMVAMLVLSGCASVSQPVYKVPENNNCTEDGVKNKLCHKFDGVPYVLPQTKLKISIPVVSTAKIEGGFVSGARETYAEKGSCVWEEEDGKTLCDDNAFKKEFNKDATCIKHVFMYADELGVKITINNPNGTTKKSYKLGDVSFTSEAEPDPDQLYYVEVKGGLFERRSLDITFAAGGILNEITSSKEDKTAEFAAKTFGSILGAAAKFGSPFKTSATPEGGTISTVKSDCSSGTQLKYKNIVLRALDTLKYIESFPTTRRDELRGVNNPAPNGKDNLELRLKELDAGRDAALAMFEGGEKENTKTHEIALLPKSNGSTIPLATFSESCGLYRTVNPNSNMPSTNVPLPNEKSCKSADMPNVKAILSLPPNMTGVSLPTRISGSLDSGTNTRGIYYRVPETARISINNDKKELLVKDIPIAQLGKIASLPAQTGSSNVTYKVTLDPVTGMLLKVAITSEAMNTGIAKDLIDPVGDYLKARKDSNDELTQLQREEALLKTKKSIQDLKDAMAK